MPGVKGRTGMHGRQGRKAGAAPVASLRLTPTYAAKLALITRWRRMVERNPLLGQRSVVEGWIDDHMGEVDERVLIADEEYEQAIRDGINP